MLETLTNTRPMEFASQFAEPAARLRLLVVDADAAVRSACAEIAASLGYAVENTGDLEQARTLLRGHPADILLVNLPPATSQGLELVSEVKFLYVKGAFTGANHAKDGLLVSAEGGTVFLDEIGELSLDLQAKLLRALQE
jgi:DNA-binding NtrC family response regulator